MRRGSIFNPHPRSRNAPSSWFSLKTTLRAPQVNAWGAFVFSRPTIAKLLPETADGLLDELDRRFPEPRPNPNDTDEDIRWRLAQRSVVLQMRDAYAFARKAR